MLHLYGTPLTTQAYLGYLITISLVCRNMWLEVKIPHLFFITGCCDVALCRRVNVTAPHSHDYTADGSAVTGKHRSSEWLHRLFTDIIMILKRPLTGTVSEGEISAVLKQNVKFQMLLKINNLSFNLTYSYIAVCFKQPQCPGSIYSSVSSSTGSACKYIVSLLTT